MRFEGNMKNMTYNTSGAKHFLDGVATAIIAHASAWLIIVGWGRVYHLCGHIAAVLMLQFLEWLRH
jgi:hypothetical protein